jgi:hypothetical protein
MAFISMVFATVVLTIVVIGLIIFLIAAVIDIVWIVRASRKKKTHIAIKILAVLMSIIGFVLFVLPVGYFLIDGMISEIEEKREFDSIETKIYVDDYVDGFEYKGMNLVRIDFVNIANDEELRTDGALVFGENQYYSICTVDNEGDFDIFVLQGTHLKYCDENQLQAIFNYYHNEAELTASISYLDEDSYSHEYECDFDKNILFEIRDYYDTKECDYSGSVTNVELDYRIDLCSSDGLFSESISLVEIGDDIVLRSGSSGGNMSGITLPEDKEDYVRSQIREWTNLY